MSVVRRKARRVAKALQHRDASVDQEEPVLKNHDLRCFVFTDFCYHARMPLGATQLQDVRCRRLSCHAVSEILRAV